METWKSHALAPLPLPGPRLTVRIRISAQPLGQVSGQAPFAPPGPEGRGDNFARGPRRVDPAR